MLTFKPEQTLLRKVGHRMQECKFVTFPTKEARKQVNEKREKQKQRISKKKERK